ncbi:unnamed protein product, partial [Rotaria magnacalcarata]
GLGVGMALLNNGRFPDGVVY